jgi:hypothetical protein
VVPAVAHADRATDRFAPDQIQMAEDSLRAARAAAEAADYRRASALARAARVDARITYGMTDDDRLRSQAASIAEQADTLARSVGAQAQ